jgi:hypothetical protein
MELKSTKVLRRAGDSNWRNISISLTDPVEGVLSVKASLQQFSGLGVAGPGNLV